jgi:hypothetical protein
MAVLRSAVKPAATVAARRAQYSRQRRRQTPLAPAAPGVGGQADRAEGVEDDAVRARWDKTGIEGAVLIFEAFAGALFKHSHGDAETSG